MKTLKVWILACATFGSIGCQLLSGGDDLRVFRPGLKMDAGPPDEMDSSVLDGSAGASAPSAGSGAGASGTLAAGSGGEPSEPPTATGSGGMRSVSPPDAESVDASMPSEPPCMPSVPGAACNLIDNCGCSDSESCNVTVDGGAAKVQCTRRGDVAPGSRCDATDDCTVGHGCVAGTCHAYCESDATCSANGRCVEIATSKMPIEGVRMCFETCSSDGDCATDCCSGGLCKAADQCESACSSDAECNGGCCRSGGCQTGAACETVRPGQSCEIPRECIGFAAGDATCADDGTGAVCLTRCSTADECPSGCCSPLDTGGGVCGKCQCRAPGSTCAVTGDCCEGATCVGTEQSDVRECMANCTTNAECPSGCCAELESGGHVCAEAEYCP